MNDITDQKLLEMLMASAANAMDRYPDDLTKGRVAIEYFNGVHQWTAFLMRFDGEVSPHRLNKVLSEGMKLVGLTVSGPKQQPESP